jgi:hypothetical protein
MGFNKRYLPELDKLREIREKMNSDEEFLNMYLYRPDTVIGSTDSMDYVKGVESLVKEKNDNQRSHF